MAFHTHTQNTHSAVDVKCMRGVHAHSQCSRNYEIRLSPCGISVKPAYACAVHSGSQPISKKSHFLLRKFHCRNRKALPFVRVWLLFGGIPQAAGPLRLFYSFGKPLVPLITKSMISDFCFYFILFFRRIICIFPVQQIHIYIWIKWKPLQFYSLSLFLRNLVCVCGVRYASM